VSDFLGELISYVVVIAVIMAIIFGAVQVLDNACKNMPVYEAVLQDGTVRQLKNHAGSRDTIITMKDGTEVPLASIREIREVK